MPRSFSLPVNVPKDGTRNNSGHADLIWALSELTNLGPGRNAGRGEFQFFHTSEFRIPPFER
ncbi:MAG: hypothetical protein V7646_923, partial [Pseudonocardia sp.]